MSPLRLCSLQSGSAGNATYIASDTTRILIDAGLALADLEARLAAIGHKPTDLDGLLITHEHGDHVRSAGGMQRAHKVPVYLNAPTFDRAHRRLGKRFRGEIFITGEEWTIGDLVVRSYPLSHDGVETVCFRVSCGDAALAVVTDLGEPTPPVSEAISDVDLLLFEFNHDAAMLQQGRYSDALKARIAGPYGHLSNRQAGDFLRASLTPRTRTLLLAHLSGDNNTPETALRAFHEFTAARPDLAKLEPVLTHRDAATRMLDVVVD